jgi:hypothetical protein
VAIIGLTGGQFMTSGRIRLVHLRSEVDRRIADEQSFAKLREIY